MENGKRNVPDEIINKKFLLKLIDIDGMLLENVLRTSQTSFTFCHHDLLWILRA